MDKETEKKIRALGNILIAVGAGIWTYFQTRSAQKDAEEFERLEERVALLESKQ